MSTYTKDWQIWIIQNLALLSKRYGKNNVILSSSLTSLWIYNYLLPTSWRQTTSRLLIVLPEKSKIFYTPPDRFYLDWGLRTNKNIKPDHYFENSNFNDMANKKMARFSFHLQKGWRPHLDCLKGTTLLDVINALYVGMDIAAKET